MSVTTCCERRPHSVQSPKDLIRAQEEFPCFYQKESSAQVHLIARQGPQLPFDGNPLFSCRQPVSKCSSVAFVCFSDRDVIYDAIDLNGWGLHSRKLKSFETKSDLDFLFAECEEGTDNVLHNLFCAFSSFGIGKDPELRTSEELKMLSLRVPRIWRLLFFVRNAITVSKATILSDEWGCSLVVFVIVPLFVFVSVLSNLKRQRLVN